MSNELDALTVYYETHDENARLLTRYGQVEYITTMTYLRRYLRPGMRVMDIGAGTGQYSHALAQQGYSVDAVELIESNIQVFRQNTQPGTSVTVQQGNAMDLSAFPSGTYDITLLLGPLYHLYEDTHKLTALSEALRVTKPGGVMFVAYCMADPSILRHGFLRGNIHDLLANGLLDPVTFETTSTPREVFELHRKQDIDALRSHFDVAQLHFVATDGYANHFRQTMQDMDEATFQVFLRYHLATCERPDLVGMSTHTLDIVRKNSGTQR